jgi:hypothetical protein
MSQHSLHRRFVEQIRAVVQGKMSLLPIFVGNQGQVEVGGAPLDPLRHSLQLDIRSLPPFRFPFGRQVLKDEQCLKYRMSARIAGRV